MPNLNIKDMPQKLYQQLRQRAAEHRRSINSEVIVSLERALLNKRVNPRDFLVRLNDIQLELSGPPLTDSFLKKAKRQGRL